MEQIKDILPPAVAQLARPTSVEQVSTRASADLDKTLDLAFEPFRTLNDSQLIQMKAAARSFAFDMITGNTSPYWLSLLGTSGAGKTMLAKIVSRLFRCNKHGAVVAETPSRIWYANGGFIKWATLVQWMREGDWRAFDDVSRDWFVCVDDLGAEHATDFSRAKLYEMFDRGENKWRIWTANLSLQEITDRIDARISSRMLRNNSIVLDVDVPDYNTRGAHR